MARRAAGKQIDLLIDYTEIELLDVALVDRPVSRKWKLPFLVLTDCVTGSAVDLDHRLAREAGEPHAHREATRSSEQFNGFQHFNSSVIFPRNRLIGWPTRWRLWARTPKRQVCAIPDHRVASYAARPARLKF